MDLIADLCRHSADQLFASSESRTPQRREGFETLVNRIIASPVVQFRSPANVTEPYAPRDIGLGRHRSRVMLISISKYWLHPNRALRSLIATLSRTLRY